MPSLGPVRRQVDATILLLPAGALLGHAAAYGIGGTHGAAAPAHGYLTGVVAVAAPLALAGLVWHAWQGGRGGKRPSMRLLVVGQPLAFVAQEGAEHVVGGHGLASVLQSPAVRVGIAAQVLVALTSALLVRAARATGRAVVAMLRRRRDWGGHESGPRPPTVTPAPLAPMVGSSCERGPPHLLVPA